MRQRFRYRAARRDGAVHVGTVVAASRAEVVDWLSNEGSFVLEVKPSAGATALTRPMPAKQLAIAFRGLATFVSSGISLDRALDATAKLSPPRLREVLSEVSAGIGKGQSLSAALGEQQERIPATTIGLVGAGERADALPAALEQAATQLEAEAELRSRVRQALAYPALLTIGGIVSLAVIVTMVLPRFALLLGDLGQEIPRATRILLAVSQLPALAWVMLPLGVAALGLGWRMWTRSEAGLCRWHELLLGTPGVGRLRHVLGSSRITHAFGGSLQAGLPLIPALDAAKDATADAALAGRLTRVRARVIEGEAFAAACRAERLLTESCLELVAIGEQNARLGEFSKRAGEMAAREADRSLKAAVAILEPALVILIGGVIAVVAAAMLQAVYALRPLGS